MKYTNLQVSLLAMQVLSPSCGSGSSKTIESLPAELFQQIFEDPALARQDQFNLATSLPHARDCFKEKIKKIEIHPSYGRGQGYMHLDLTCEDKNQPKAEAEAEGSMSVTSRPNPEKGGVRISIGFHGPEEENSAVVPRSKHVFTKIAGQGGFTGHPTLPNVKSVMVGLTETPIEINFDPMYDFGKSLGSYYEDYINDLTQLIPKGSHVDIKGIHFYEELNPMGLKDLLTAILPRSILLYIDYDRLGDEQLERIEQFLGAMEQSQLSSQISLYVIDKTLTKVLSDPFKEFMEKINGINVEIHKIEIQRIRGKNIPHPEIEESKGFAHLCQLNRIGAKITIEDKLNGLPCTIM